MQLIGTLLSLYLLSNAAFPVLARNSNSTSSQCRTISRLERLVEIASNTTLLDEKSDGNATRAEEIQAKASAAADELTTLQSNDTLVTLCAQRSAVQAMESDCRLQSRLEKIIDNTNSTSSKRSLAHVPRRSLYKPGEEFPSVLESRKNHRGNNNNNGTETVDLAAAQETLAALSSNATLQEFCAARSTAQDCDRIAKLSAVMAMAANDTALSAKFDGDADKIARFQAKAAKAEEKLTELQGNSTLVSVCEAEAAASTGDDGTTGTGAEEATNDSDSAATRVGLDGAMATSGLGMFFVALVSLLL